MQTTMLTAPAAVGPRSGTRFLWLPLLLTLFLASCAPEQILGDEDLPPNVPDPTEMQTPDGALAAYFGVLRQFQFGFGANLSSFIPITGLLSDELQSGSDGNGLNIDARQLPEYITPTLEGDYKTAYDFLQRVRGQGREALGALTKYAPDASPAFRGHLYSVLGYTEIFLADLFCSGIPLSTLDFEEDYTYQPGSTTEEVYRHAAALFDSALALSADSIELLNLARVGKARALLAMGEYAEAGNTVDTVPEGFQYQLQYAAQGFFPNNGRNFAVLLRSTESGTVADREGGNGLAYVSSNDPRTAVILQGTNRYGHPHYLPVKYATTGDSPIVLADWVEARLIEAEAALQAGEILTWLGILNRLRQTAISPALPDTTDPGTPEGRVDLLFRERAFWLFLTGHRQGDLRRLIREYGRTPEMAYPTGAYPGGNGVYGTDVTAPIPAEERAYNPKFTGCFHRGA